MTDKNENTADNLLTQDREMGKTKCAIHRKRLKLLDTIAEVQRKYLETEDVSTRITHSIFKGIRSYTLL
jgi:hypothetical protein